MKAVLRFVLVTAVIAWAATLVARAVQPRKHERDVTREEERITPVPRIERVAVPAIEMEAQVFAAVSSPIALTAARRATAHPRTLATFRALRAYPGAPPRIPHGLTADEYRDTRCRTCHERGGYSMRFEAYAPVTPHPQLTDCVQCHLADDAVVGVALPDLKPDALCRQCHAPGAQRATYAASDWRTENWPSVGIKSMTDAPPPIPHDLELRGNCLTCHSGPGAVSEIRTDHPERVDCRQCHVTTTQDNGVFSRKAK